MFGFRITAAPNGTIHVERYHLGNRFGRTYCMNREGRMLYAY